MAPLRPFLELELQNDGIRRKATKGGDQTLDDLPPLRLAPIP